MLSLLIRSPFRRDALRLVNFNFKVPASAGCIILTCHTPWKRLLVQCCIEQKFAFIVSNVTWAHNKERIRRTGEGFAGLRNIIDHINKGGRIVITIDAFNKLRDCLVKFQGKDLNVSLFPIRLAKLTGVPIVVALPQLNNGEINFITFSQIDNRILEQDTADVVQKLILFLEDEINKDPSIWQEYVN